MTIDERCSFFRDFAVGDLIYGTQIDRDRYIELAEKKSTKVTIDAVTRELDDGLRGMDDYVQRDLTAGEAALLPQPAQAFLWYAKQTTYWRKMNGTGVSDYTKSGVAKARPGLGNKMKWSQAYLRAKCKAGIGFVLDSGYTIRFVLDSLYNEASMDALARKESMQPWHTGSELRYVYKKRNEIDAKHGGKVVFYVDGEPAAAPWVQFPDAWREYGNTRLDDYTYVPEHARK